MCRLDPQGCPSLGRTSHPYLALCTEPSYGQPAVLRKARFASSTGQIHDAVCSTKHKTAILTEAWPLSCSVGLRRVRWVKARTVYLKIRSEFFFFFFFFCVPGHARCSVRWVRRSPQSAAMSQPVPKASCGPPPDWAMSGVSSHQRWGRIAGCGWGFEDPCRMDICLNGKFSVCGGGRGVDSVQFSV